MQLLHGTGVSNRSRPCYALLKSPPCPKLESARKIGARHDANSRLISSPACPSLKPHFMRFPTLLFGVDGQGRRRRRSKSGDITQSKERSRSVGRSVGSVCLSKMRRVKRKGKEGERQRATHGSPLRARARVCVWPSKRYGFCSRCQC